MNTHVNKEIILSIGMIVKNEEAVLHRCLKSLQPLRDAIPCQLIIVDTGSTDHTVDIAREYTDQVYHFTWCDDFAAARNFGVERAKGKWFLYIDADEWFEDVTELIEFFQSGAYRRYGHAAYTIRNYLISGKYQEYGDMLGVRMTDMSKGVVFYNRIHETIITSGRKKTFTRTIAGHSGYSTGNSEEFLEQKETRNIKLLKKSIEEDPNEPCNYWYMAKQYPIYVKQEEHFKYISTAYEKVQTCKNHLYYSPIVRNYVICLYIQGEKEKAEEIIHDYFVMNRKDSIFVEMDLTYQLMLIYLEDGNYRQALGLIAQYRQYYNRIVQGELHEADFTCDSLTYSSENYQKSFLLEAMCRFQLKDIEAAYALIQQIRAAELGITNFRECIPGMIQIAVAAEAYTYVVRLYQELLNERDEKEVEFLEQVIEQNVSMKKKADICEVFCESIQTSGVYSDYQQLQQIRRMLNLNDRKDVSGVRAMYNLLEKKKFLVNNYGEVLFAAWWHGEPIRQMLDEIEVEDFVQYTITSEAYVLQTEDTIAELTSHYITAQKEQTSLKEVYFVLCTLEHMLLAECRTEQNQMIISTSKMQLFENYIQLGERYIYQLYAPDILTDEKISILSRHYRFFYYAGQGLSVREENFQQYGRLIKKALEQCPLFTSLVQASLQLFEKRVVQSNQPKGLEKAEFEGYAQMVKEKIAALITQGMKEEAVSLIHTYEKINPADSDGITLLYSLLEADHSMIYKN